MTKKEIRSFEVYGRNSSECVSSGMHCLSTYAAIARSYSRLPLEHVGGERELRTAGSGPEQCHDAFRRVALSLLLQPAMHRYATGDQQNRHYTFSKSQHTARTGSCSPCEEAAWLNISMRGRVQFSALTILPKSHTVAPLFQSEPAPSPVTFQIIAPQPVSGSRRLGLSLQPSQLRSGRFVEHVLGVGGSLSFFSSLPRSVLV